MNTLSILSEAVTEVNKALRVLGYNNFRAGQENAVARVVSGNLYFFLDLLVHIVTRKL